MSRARGGPAAGAAPILRVCVVRRGRCPHRPEPAARPGGRALHGAYFRRGAPCAPAGGHMGPPLRILTNGADGRGHLIRHGLRPCHLPLKGNAGTAGASPRPTWSTSFVGADVPIGPQAATWGRPYENSGPLSPVGADLRVRPPVLGAHIGAPLRRRAESPRPTRCIFPQGRGPKNYQFSIINFSFLTPSSPQAPYRSLSPDGESSLIPLLRLSPPNPRLSPLGFGGGPKNSYLLSPLSTLHSQFSSIRFRYCPV